ncbi:MAG: type II toxin-antitoxin system RelE/ParE family toxin [Candidatus Bathyarchaeia archaeon]
MLYEVKLHRSVVKSLESIEPKFRERIKSALRRLGENPYEPRSGVDLARLAGTKGRQDLYRLRIGDYRAIYAIEGKVIYVTDLFHRGKGYN